MSMKAVFFSSRYVLFFCVTREHLLYSHFDEDQQDEKNPIRVVKPQGEEIGIVPVIFQHT